MAITLLQPWAILAKGPPWMMAGLFSSVWTRFGSSASFSKAVMAPAAPISPAVTGLPVVGIGADDLGEPLFQIRDAGSQAEDRHDLAGYRDVKTVLAGGAIDLAAQTVHDEAELSVVHVHAALPGDAAGINVQGVALLDAVVDHGRQQVVGGRQWRADPR